MARTSLTSFWPSGESFSTSTGEFSMV